ncbi:MAG: TetR/AcrR family transcriptional regulator [Bacteroidota bacterium]
MSRGMTKEKILKASVKLFNKKGLANTRLLQIAKESGISVGNLAYHYKNKEAIVYALSERLFQEATTILNSYEDYHQLNNLDQQLSHYFQFLQSYPFYFQDLLEIERAYPMLNAKRQTYILKMIQQLQERFKQFCHADLMKPEPRKGFYRNTAQAIWIIITSWMTHQRVRGSNTFQEERFKEMIWSQIYPHFTETGVAAFEQVIAPDLQISAN